MLLQVRPPIKEALPAYKAALSAITLIIEVLADDAVLDLATGPVDWSRDFNWPALLETVLWLLFKLLPLLLTS